MNTTCLGATPLEQIFKKRISSAPARLQRMLLRCLKYDIEIKYTPGRKIPGADTLSRVCIEKDDTQEQVQELSFVEGIKCPIDLKRVRDACDKDATHTTLWNIVYRRWQEQRKQCPAEVWEYWNFRCELVIDNGHVFKGDRLVIPQELRADVLKAIHTGHQGETKCVLLARETVFWPGMASDIKRMVQICPACVKYQPAQARLPLMQLDLPTRP